MRCTIDVVAGVLEPAGDETVVHDEPPVGRHRAAVERTSWRRRPRAPLQEPLHRSYLLVVFVIWAALWAGGSVAVSAPSLLSRLGGVLAFICGAALVAGIVLYLRRPVED